jgi:hypothetical protein
MTTPFTPGETAWLDQRHAGMSRHLDFWVAELRTQTTEHGRDQGTADVVSALLMSPPELRDELLIVALLRLASQDPSAVSQPPELYDGPPQ